MNAFSFAYIWSEGDDIIKKIIRCRWAEHDLLLQSYHDTEWGVPEFNEQRLFAKLSLEIFQAGLAWKLILRKHPAINQAFENFNYYKLAKYSTKELNNLLNNSLIIRNRSKIMAILHNAKVMLKLHRSNSSLKALTWDNVNGVPLDHLITSYSKIDYSKFVKPVLIQFRYFGFKRIGPKTLYSYLQAVGVINDHLITCFRHSEISKMIR